MAVHRDFRPGDFLVFQLEAGFGLLRLLAIDDEGDAVTWHVAAYNDLFPDVETAENAASEPSGMTVSLGHAALTNRAFESTQVARIANSPLTIDDLKPYNEWLNDPSREVSDRSIRLMLGLR